MKQSFTRKEFKNDLEKWLNTHTSLKFYGEVVDYQITLSAKIPAKATKNELRELDYLAYKNHFSDKLLTKNQFDFHIYINKKYKIMTVWITALNNKISKYQLDKCKRTLQKFFMSIDN